MLSNAVTAAFRRCGRRRRWIAGINYSATSARMKNVTVMDTGIHPNAKHGNPAGRAPPTSGITKMETETWGNTPHDEIVRQILTKERNYFVPSEPQQATKINIAGVRIDDPAQKPKPTEKPMEQTTAPPAQSELGAKRTTTLRNYWGRMTPEQKSAEMLKRLAARKKKPVTDPTLAEQATVKLQRQYDEKLIAKLAPSVSCKPNNPDFVERLSAVKRRIRTELAKQQPRPDLDNLRAEYLRRIAMIDQVKCWMLE